MRTTLVLIPDGLNPREEIHTYSGENIKHILLFNEFLAHECCIYNAEDPEKVILDFGYTIILMYGSYDILTWLSKIVTDYQKRKLKDFYNTYLKFLKMEYATIDENENIISHGYQEVNVENLNKFYQVIEEQNQRERIRKKDVK